MPLRSRLYLLALALTITAAPAYADNWARFRGPNGSGISNDKNIPIRFSTKENMRWKVKIPGMGHSSPIVWDDRVFLQTSSADASKRSLLCLDAKTGREVWTRSIDAIKPNQTVRKDSSLASATAVTDGEAVYIPFWDGKNVILTAYNFKGDKLWERNLGEFVSQHGVGASPILYKDLLVYSIDKDAFRDANKKIGPVANPSTLYAFDKKTGKTVWETPREAIRACYSAPMLLERPGVGPELLITSSSAITSYQPETGKSNWYWTWSFPKDPLRTIAGATYVKGMLLACSGDGSGERFMVGVELKGNGDGVQAEQVWSNPKAKETPYVTCPIVKGEHVYFVSDLGFAGCIVAKTGKKVWYERMPSPKFYASPVMIDGKIYAVGEQGDVYVIAAETKFGLLATNPLDGEVTRASPAVANGALYIRSQNYLYCIGK